MRENPTLDQALTAYEAARAAAADTATVARLAMDTYVREATHQGHSTRDIAKALCIPKSTIHRIRLGVGTSLPEAWSTPTGYVAAHNAAWAEAPGQQIDRAPFEVHVDEDGARRYAIGGDVAAAVYPHLRGDRK